MKRLTFKNTLLFYFGITLVSCEMPNLPFSFQDFQNPVDYSHKDGTHIIEPSKAYVDQFAEEQTKDLTGEQKKRAKQNLKEGDFSTFINESLDPPFRQCFKAEQSLVQRNDLTPLESALMEADKGFPFNLFTDVMPEECGYGYKNLSNRTVTKMCTAIREVANDESASCHKSNCTTASFIGIVQLMKTRPDWVQMKSKFTCKYKRRFGAAYQEYIKADGLRKMFKKFKLGPTKRIRIKHLQKQVDEGWPAPGDPILVQRKNLSGHSAMFHSYEYRNNKIYKVCFWSSNSGTKGQGIKCEPIRSLQFIDAAKVKFTNIDKGDNYRGR